MNEADLALFLDSFERCLQDERFIKVFYEIFIASSEEIPTFFVGTDFAKQRRVLKASLYEMVAVSARRTADPSALSALTQRHRELKIQPHHYELWMQSLILAVAKCDSYFNQDVARVWRDAFQVGINYMKDGAWKIKLKWFFGRKWGKYIIAQKYLERIFSVSHCHLREIIKRPVNLWSLLNPVRKKELNQVS